MTVPFHDPAREYEGLREEIDRAVSCVLSSGRYVLGEVVERFELSVASLVGVRHAIGVANGTDALALALEARGVGRGDEVILPPFTFIATAGAVARLGAVPVFADIDADSFNLNPEAAAAAVSSRTVAIVPVHLFGQMADMTAFRSLASRHGLALIEDAAQALGASQRRRTSGESGSSVRAGAAADAGCFSFYPTKNLAAAGDAGLITTDDDALAGRLRSLRNHGRVPGSPDHSEYGHNSRLDALQAAILSVKLPHLDAWNDRRRAHAAAYARALGAACGPAGLILPRELAGNRHIFHQYALRCVAPGEREAARRRLDEAGIGHAIYYELPLHCTTAIARSASGEGGPQPARGEFPEAEKASREVLCLPVFAHLTDPERGAVIEALVAA